MNQPATPNLRLVVPEELAGQRLDVAIARLAPQISRRQARRLVDDGAVFLDDKRVQVCSRPVRAGASIAITAAGEEPRRDTPVPRILACDGDVVVVDKSAGVPTEPTREGARGTLKAGLEDTLRADGKDITFLHAAHRLDTFTTGVVVFARTAEAARVVGRQLHDGTAERRYLAIVTGVPTWMRARLDWSLTRSRDSGGHIRVDDNGAPAVTLATVLATGKTAALALCAPRTGRTHQLRVHLAHAGHALVGDRSYGGGHAPHLGLHALSLAIVHPAGHAIRYAATPPDAFCEAAEAAGIPAGVVRDVARHVAPEMQ